MPDWDRCAVNAELTILSRGIHSIVILYKEEEMNRKLQLIGITLVIIISISCSFLTGTTQPSMASMEQIKIVNSHVRGSDTYPGCKNLPLTRQYGVCFVAYDPNNPEDLTKPTSDMVVAIDGETTIYEMPPGTYQLQEWQTDLEINQDTNYTPCFKKYVRPLETIEIPTGKEIVFGSERTLAAPGEFIEGKTINPNCIISKPDRIPADTSAVSQIVTPNPTAVSQIVTPNPTKVAYVGGFSGKWETNWGEMTCRVNELKVHCEYAWDQGRIDASLSADGRTMEGQWAESPSYSPPDDGGRVTFTLSEDGNTIDGYWWYGQNTDGGSWTGTRK
jgi:hypothetical protein